MPLKHRHQSTACARESKIIPFPTPKQELKSEWTELIRGLLQQQFPKDTWRRLRFDETTQLSARVFLGRILKDYDIGRKMAHLVEALPFSKGENRRVARQILFREK